MSHDHKTHIKHAIFNICELTDNTSVGAGVLAINDTNKVTRIPAGTTGQLLTYTGTNPYKISWQTSSASSVAQYQTLTNTDGSIGSDPGTIVGSTPIDGNFDVYAIAISSISGTYSNKLTNTSVINGHKIVITIVKIVSGSRYRLYSANTVFNGSGALGGGPGYFEMDSVGQGVQLVYTEYGWAVIGGGGATLGIP
jgi:hypothetical protein